MTNPETIKELRRSLGLSQSQFARALGVSVVAVQKWEQGTRNPTPLVALIADFILNHNGARLGEFIKRRA